MVDEEKKKAKPKKKEEKAANEAEPKIEPKAEAKQEAKEHKAEPKKRKKGASKKAATKVFVARGKRKESIARATITEGKGTVRLNSMNVNGLSNRYVRDIIMEPLRYVGPEANGIDIAVSVNGGGMMGQAQAARTAIANVLVMYFEGMNLKQKFIDIDRSLVIEDTRRVEPKKFRGPKARARFQKSYR
jgi:small subunit ribosomal protein S9